MTKTNTKPEENKKTKSPWVKSGENLMRYRPSGMYFARVRYRGELFRESLKTDDFQIAKERLANYVLDLKRCLPSGKRSGRMTMGSVIDLFLTELESNRKMRDSSKRIVRAQVAALERTWTGLRERPVRKVTEEECKHWADRFSKCGLAKKSSAPSPSFFNATIDTLRQLFALAAKQEVRVDNPAMAIKKTSMTRAKKDLNITPEQFEAFVNAIETAGGRYSKDCADLVRFLAYSGCRKSEAASLIWQDISFERGEIRVRVTKNGEERTIPMIGDMRALLTRMKAECPQAQSTDPLLLVTSCQKSMTEACKKVGIRRLTHHSMRHYFCTKCLQAGIDIPTVAGWMGHLDGGVLMLKTYSHHQSQHSQSMAARVSFAVTPVAPSTQPTATV